LFSSVGEYAGDAGEYATKGEREERQVSVVTESIQREKKGNASLGAYLDSSGCRLGSSANTLDLGSYRPDVDVGEYAGLVGLQARLVGNKL
jgi:hypothetical protein